MDPTHIFKLTGVPYLSHLEFENFSLRKILKKTARLHQKYPLDRARLWISTYFQKELLAGEFPPVSLRWIDEEMGWGVFADKDFASMEFIAEYTGIVRERRKEDGENSYCFEYLILPDMDVDYLIDAQDQGGISRYINHSFTPNSLRLHDRRRKVSHIIFFTKRAIQAGEQLFYDYGPNYWKKRKKPR